MGKSGMWKITKALDTLENKITTRKDRKLALKQARTEYKNLVNAIKKTQHKKKNKKQQKQKK